MDHGSSDEFKVTEKPFEIPVAELRQCILDLVNWLNVNARHHGHRRFDLGCDAVKGIWRGQIFTRQSGNNDNHGAGHNAVGFDQYR
jgi:hypothetical protein